MSAYDAVLLRAVGSLPQPTPKSRAEIYERARRGLSAQLRTVAPPMHDAAIIAEQELLEAAVARVEASFARLEYEQGPRDGADASSRKRTSVFAEAMTEAAAGSGKRSSDSMDRISLSARVNWYRAILRKFQSEVSGVEACALVSKHGSIIASAIPAGKGELRVSRMREIIRKLGDGAAAELCGSAPQEVMIRGESGYVVMTKTTGESLLLVVADERSKLGLVLLEMRGAFRELQSLAHEDAGDREEKGWVGAAFLFDDWGVWPGLALTTGLAGCAFALREEFAGARVLSPMILAMILGIAFQNLVGAPKAAKAGLAFSSKKILRWAIVLLGLQLTAAQIGQARPAGLAVIIATVVVSFGFTVTMGRLLGVERKLAELIAVGTSICGASAIVATNTVTEAEDEDVSYALACISLFGSVSMFFYPLLPGLLHLDVRSYGLWAGASIHEIAQVVGSTFQVDQQAGTFGMIAKLSRVMMLAPTVLLLGWAAALRDEAGGRGRAVAGPAAPWFVLGFVALVAVNSVVEIDAAVKSWIVMATSFLLTAALAGLGLQTDLRALRAKGIRPLLLGGASWLFISGFSLALVESLKSFI